MHGAGNNHNPWNSGFAGNYYSNNTGNDPHPITGGNSTDRVPIMHPWTDTP